MKSVFQDRTQQRLDVITMNTSAEYRLCFYFRLLVCPSAKNLLMNFHVVFGKDRPCDKNNQGVALTGRNTTGPPCSVTVEL